MKKLMSLAALAVVASVVAASAEDVLSANAVGYIKKTIEPGEMAPLVYPFDILGSEEPTGVKWVETQIADELPGLSTVYFWRESSTGPGWKGYNKTAANKWMGSEIQQTVIQDGEMFFVKPAASATITEYTLAGEVPAEKQRTRGLQGGGNLNVVGFAYPTDVKFVDTSLADAVPALTPVYFWVNGGWKGYNKNAAGKWMGEVTKIIVPAGDGFFVKLSGDNLSWVQERPYTWPNED